MRTFLAATVVAIALIAGLGRVAGSAPLAVSEFTYNAAAPLGVKVLHQWHEGMLTIEETTFPSPKGGLIHAQLILPRNKKHRAGVLFVHWLGDPCTNGVTPLNELPRRSARPHAYSLIQVVIGVDSALAGLFQ